MSQPPRPLSAEEEAELRRDMNLDSEWANPIEGRWPWWCARLLATLDAARDSAGLDRVLTCEHGLRWTLSGWLLHAASVGCDVPRLSEPQEETP